MNGKRVDQLLTLVLGRQSYLRRIRILKNMVSELVRQVEATPTGLKCTVNHRDSDILNSYIGRIRAGATEVNREAVKTNSLYLALQCNQWALLTLKVLS